MTSNNKTHLFAYKWHFGHLWIQQRKWSAGICYCTVHYCIPPECFPSHERCVYFHFFRTDNALYQCFSSKIKHWQKLEPLWRVWWVLMINTCLSLKRLQHKASHFPVGNTCHALHVDRDECNHKSSERWRCAVALEFGPNMTELLKQRWENGISKSIGIFKL